MSIYRRKIDVDVTKLISEIKKHDCLWNVGSKAYRKRGSGTTNRAWISICTALGKPASVLRAKWKNLRDTYRKEMKKNFYDDEYNGIWQYFEELDFIRDSFLITDKGGELGSDDENNTEIQDGAEINTRPVDKTVIKLINEVKKYECLWNNDYHLKGKERAKEADEAWKQIALDLGKRAYDVHKKWKGIKHKYIKEVRNNFSDGQYKGCWQYFNMMDFMKVEYVDNTEFDDTPSEESFDEPLTPSESHNNDGGHGINSQIKIEMGSIDNTTMDNTVEYLQNLEDPIPVKRARLDEEYDLMFLKSLLPFFRGMDNVKKLVLRSKIQDMVRNELASE